MKSSTGGEVACRTIEITVSDFARYEVLHNSTDATMTHVGKLLNPTRIGEPQHLKRGGFRYAVRDRSEVIHSKRRDVRVVVRLRGEAATARHLAIARGVHARAEADEGARLEIASLRAC